MKILVHQQPMLLVSQDLNEIPGPVPHEQIDLNVPMPDQDVNVDLQLVIFNPVAPEDSEQAQEIHLLQPQGEVFILNLEIGLELPAQPDEEIDQPNEEILQMMVEAHNEAPLALVDPPHVPASPIPSSDEEIPYDQLLGAEPEDSFDHHQQEDQDIQIQQNQQQPEPEGHQVPQDEHPGILNLGLAQPGQFVQSVQEQISEDSVNMILPNQERHQTP